jgi:hypothetical protein
MKNIEKVSIAAISRLKLRKTTIHRLSRYPMLKIKGNQHRAAKICP